MSDYTYRRGDICWFHDPEPIRDGTYISHGTHPAVIVSSDGNNINNMTVIIAPMTSNIQRKLYPGQFDVLLDGTPGRVRCEQLRVVDKSTLEKPIARLSAEAISKLDSVIAETLGLNMGTGLVVANAIK